MSPARMETKDNYFNELKDELVDYSKTRLELAKIITYEKTSRIAAFVFSFLLICFFLFFTLIFLGFTAAYYFSLTNGSYIIGFGAVAGINLLLFLVIFLFRKRLIEKPVINMVIKILSEGESHEQDTKS